MIRLACRNCGKGITAPDKMAGKRAKCPGCQGALSIPAAENSNDEIYSDFEVVEDAPPPVKATSRRAAPQEIPTIQAVDDEDDRPRRRSRRAVDDDDDYDEDEESRPRRRKRRREFTASSGTPRGTVYAICYNCGADAASKVRWTMWGSFFGPAILSHVKCDQCGTTYNGKSGKSNTTAVIIYVVVTALIAGTVGTIAAVIGAMK